MILHEVCLSGVYPVSFYEQPIRISSSSTISDIIDNTQATRLESNWAVSTAPSGPISTNNPLGITSVDLGAIYPIALCRLFFPSAAEVVGIPKFYQTYAAVYAEHVARRVWIWGNPYQPNRPYYDSLNGASFYNVSLGGGSFNLAGWKAGSAPRCNCYDLAAIMQLGCCLLIDVQNNELLKSRWVLDATTATPGASNKCFPEMGSRTRPQYAADHTDAAAGPAKKYTGNTINRLKGVPNSFGNCCMTTDSLICTVLHGLLHSEQIQTTIGTLTRLPLTRSDELVCMMLRGSYRPSF